MDKDTLTSLLNSTGSDTTSQITQFLQPLLIISTLLTVVIIIVYIYNSIQKRRINQAILRIDKNVQILVERGNELPTHELKPATSVMTEKPEQTSEL